MFMRFNLYNLQCIKLGKCKSFWKVYNANLFYSFYFSKDRHILPVNRLVAWSNETWACECYERVNYSVMSKIIKA